MNRTIKGKCGIKATVICDSISEQGKRITTFELEYPRLVHSELMTHRMLSRNAASSRAIPFEKMLKQLNGRPVRFGAANKGMQDKGEEHTAEVRGPHYFGDASDAWNDAKYDAVSHAKSFYEAGYHKQVYNRLLEPFQMIKTVVTATGWNNFFWLRDDDAADPTIRELAICMKKAMAETTTQVLKAGEWHLPFVETLRLKSGRVYAYSIGDEAVDVEDAIKVSAARCAAVSFRNVEYDLEKCLEVYDRLVGSEKKHSSALEHQATPISSQTLPFEPDDWEKGITHVDAEGNLWSGNFAGWIQYRQMIEGHVKKG